MEVLTINHIELGRLKNAEHVQLHTSVRNVINTAGAETMGLAQRTFMPYLQSIAQEQDIVNKAMGSPYTLEMQAADAERDTVYKRVRRKLELCELENTDSVAFKATPVVKKHLLGKYSNAVSSLAYQEETATITGFVQDCRTLLTSAQVKGIGIDDDLDELEAVNQKFNQMYQERVAEKAAGDTQLSAKLRAATDEAYGRLCIALNALANDDDPEKSEAVELCRETVSKINVVIRDAKNRLAQRLGSGAPSDSPMEEEGQDVTSEDDGAAAGE